MDPDLREALDRIEGRITGISLRLDGIRHDLNAQVVRPKGTMQSEPVLLTTAVAVVLYNLATLLGVGVDQDTVTQLVVSVGAIVAAVLARRKVTPV